MQVKIWQFFHSKITPFFSKKVHPHSTYRADSVRTSCILCGITFLLYVRYKHKNSHFYSLSAKKNQKKFGNFSTTEVFLTVVS